MGDPCEACQDEPVLARGGLCPRCAREVRRLTLDQRAVIARVEKLAADWDRLEQDHDDSVEGVASATTYGTCAYVLRAALRDGEGER